jgi:acyl-CoA thioesterase-1
MAQQVYPMARAVATLLALAATLACGSSPPAPEPVRAEPPASAAADDPRPPDGPLVVFLGDSLTAGYGLSEDQAFPAVVEERLREKGVALRVVNAGVSGDTTAGGLRRLDWVLKQKPDIVVVGLGGNDALRGQPLEVTEQNLREIVSTVRRSGARVLLLGMRIPTNYGPDYAEGFAGLYPRIASDLGVPLVPFLLEGVGGDPSLNLPDGIHPNAEGQRRVAETVEKALRPLLDGRRASVAGGASPGAGC